ncbi:MAG TPA: thioredoxin-disulfide reductase [Patescibacteria group bacterium]|nr:thioredoxin-disulfide reductase [Patescibacteria group bacterium]
MDMYDVIIVGSGPSGLTAAIYATRASLKTVVIAGLKWGGQLQLTTEVENFPGFDEAIQGPDLMLKMRKQAEKFGAEFVQADMDPTDFSKMSGGPFTVTAAGKTFTGKTLLIATGADAKTLGVPGEGKLTGHGVSYCATCDGAFFRNKNIIVVGGGDSAMEEANFLTNFAASVTIVHRRDEFKASQIMSERCKNNPKIKFLLNSQITEVKGEGRVQSVMIQNTQTRQTQEMPIDGVFVAIGHSPNTKIFQGIEVTERGFVKAQSGTHTNIEGIFVSGDVEDSRYMQAITAAGFGCMAALDIERYLAEKR